MGAEGEQGEVEEVCRLIRGGRERERGGMEGECTEGQQPP